ncbi:uncharacterized protein METZ01_LOCUS369210, partial [marine metagenome]
NQNHGTINNATWNNDVPQNAAPTATAQSVAGNEDVVQTITLAGSDADGDALTYALATNPSNGTATLDDLANLSFDGVDDYVEVPDIGNLDAFTFEMWVRIDGSIGEYKGLFGTQSWGVSRVHWQIGSDNNLRCSIDGGGGSTYGVVGNYIFDESTIGQWFHLAASYQSGETVKLFVNGVFDGEANMTQTVNLTGLRIGDVFTQPRYFDGIIDEVRISNTNRYTEDFTPSFVLDDDDNTIMLYHFNEGTGTTITDLSGNGNDGTINGATWNQEAAVTYTPNANYNGSDSFTFTASDGELTSEAATV